MEGVINNIYWKLLLTTFFWGGTFVAARYAVHEAPPFFAAACRFLIAAVILLVLARVRAWKEEKTFPLPRNFRELAGLFSLGLTGVFLYNAVFFTGLKLTTATNGALVVAINPLITALLSALCLRERIRPAQAGGLLFSLLGVAVVVSRGSLSTIATLSFNHGDLILLGAPLCWALYSVLGKKVLEDFSPLSATAYAALFGSLLLAAAAAAEHAATGGALPRFTMLGWLAVLQLALLGTVVGFVWWYQGVQQIGTARAAAFLYLVPVFGALQGALFLGEKLMAAQLVGGGMVMLGVYFGSGERLAGSGASSRLPDTEGGSVAEGEP